MNVSSEALVRSTYLGSSDIAAVLGVSRWKTPVQVYLNKTAPGWADGDPDPERERRFMRGKLMEPVVRQMAEQEFGLSITAIGQRYADPEHDFLRAEIDFEIEHESGIANCEVKTVHPFAAGEWGEEDTDEIPIEYAAQVQYGMLVTGRQACYVFALFGSDNLVRYIVRRDEETIRGMAGKAVLFWKMHVLPRNPPAALTYEDAVSQMSRMKRGLRLVAPDDIVEMVRRLDQLRQDAKAIDDEQEEIKAKFGAWAVEEARSPRGIDGEPRVVMLSPDGRECATWNLRRGSYLDQRRLTSDHPELKAAYTIEHEYRVLSLVKRKS